MTAIWNNTSITLNDLNDLSKNTLAELINIRFTEIGANYLKATMPVIPATHQPYGLLHGGASAALAETIGSVASALMINKEKQICVGIEINCNHLRGKKEGMVTATAEALHTGATTHVWDIRIHDEQERLICVSRLTVAVLARKSAIDNTNA
jgi:1,4-dihydroxy-2-naphthoyl-CoA hydrolase